jgi:hypothetical protein
MFGGAGAQTRKPVRPGGRNRGRAVRDPGERPEGCGLAHVRLDAAPLLHGGIEEDHAGPARQLVQTGGVLLPEGAGVVQRDVRATPIVHEGDTQFPVRSHAPVRELRHRPVLRNAAPGQRQGLVDQTAVAQEELLGNVLEWETTGGGAGAEVLQQVAQGGARADRAVGQGGGTGVVVRARPQQPRPRAADEAEHAQHVARHSVEPVGAHAIRGRPPAHATDGGAEVGVAEEGDSVLRGRRPDPPAQEGAGAPQVPDVLVPCPPHALVRRQQEADPPQMEGPPDAVPAPGALTLAVQVHAGGCLGRGCGQAVYVVRQYAEGAVREAIERAVHRNGVRST